MIVIKSIEVVEVKEEDWWIAHTTPKQHLDPHIAASIDTKITEEMITGIRYKTAGGKEICIGMLKNVQEAIGLPYEALKKAFENLESAEEKLFASQRINKGLVKMYDDYRNKVKSMSKWKRLKTLFIGYKNE